MLEIYLGVYAVAVTVVAAFLYKKPKRELTVEAQHLLKQILASGALVEIKVIDKSQLLLWRS